MRGVRGKQMLTLGIPLFLWMLPLAGVPVVFHLFLKVRKRTRPFPSLMFFVRADPRLSARRRIREWLALLLRMLLIAFLLLALSRPLWLGSGGGGSVAQVLVLDNSASMSGPGAGGRPKLAHTLDGAHALVSAMAPSDTAALVLLVPDTSVALPEGLTGDREALHTALDSMAPTHGGGQPASALATASTLLESSAASRREIHVFSDLQEAEWLRDAPEPHSAPANTTWMFHRLPSVPSKEPNVTIANIELPRRRLVAGRRIPCTVRLRNTDKARDAHVKLQTLDSNGMRSSHDVTVPAAGTRTLVLDVDTVRGGSGWLKTWIAHDGLETDNEAYITYAAAGRRAVVFAGPADAFGLLPAAVAPAGDGTLSGLVPRFRAAGAEAAPADDVVMVVTAWSGLERDEAALERFARRGGALLVVPGSKEVKRVPDWIGARPAAPVMADTGLPVLPMDRTASLWHDLRDDAGDVLLHDVRVFRFHPLEPAAGASTLLGLEDGRPILVQQRVGQGTVFASGVAFEPGAGTLPLRGAFLALVHGMALLRPGQDRGEIVVAGRRPTLAVLPETPVTIRALAGSALDWQGTARNVPVIPRCGVYALTMGTNTATIGVRTAPGEGRAVFLEGSVVPACEGLPHHVLPYHSAGAMLKRVRRLRTGLDLFLPLAALALLAAVMETWVVNPGARTEAASSPNIERRS